MKRVLFLLLLSFPGGAWAESALAEAMQDEIQLRSSKRCGGGAQCHELTVTCGGLPPRQASVREKDGHLEPGAAVIFATGVYGTQDYDHYRERRETLKAIQKAGLETFEITWRGPRGWGSKADGSGFHAAMCGYTAIVRWLAANRADQPDGRFCAQGNSGAALQIGYGLTSYGLGEILHLAVLSGGPPLTRVDKFCFAGKVPEKAKAWRSNGRRMADTMMGWEGQGDFCKNGKGNPQAMAEARATSLVSPTEERQLHFPNTSVKFIQSERDKSTFQGRLFFNAITSEKDWRVLPGRVHGVDRGPETAPVIRQTLLDFCPAPSAPPHSPKHSPKDQPGSVHTKDATEDNTAHLPLAPVGRLE